MRGVLLAGVLLLGACDGLGGKPDAGCEVGAVSCLDVKAVGLCVSQEDGGVVLNSQGDCEESCGSDALHSFRCDSKTRFAATNSSCDTEGATACEWGALADGGTMHLVRCEGARWTAQACECGSFRVDGGWVETCLL